MQRNHLLLLSGFLTVNVSAQTLNYPIGSTVANFTTLDSHGNYISLYDLTAAGKTVMLDFFFYDCIPCQENAPGFSELHQNYGCNQGGLACIAVDAGMDSNERSEQFSIDFGGDFVHPTTIGGPNGGPVTELFNVVSFPTICVIGADNVMVYDNVWPGDLATLEDAFPEGAPIFPMSCTVGLPTTPTSGITVRATVVGSTINVTLRTSRSLPLTLEVMDILGRRIVDQNLGTVPAGQSTHSVELAQSGTYMLVVGSAAAPLAAQRLFIAH